MTILSYVFSIAVISLVVGALGRLVVPGPNRIGLWRTLGVGAAGVVAGGLLGALLGIGAFSLVFEVLISAGLVYLVSGRRRSLSSPRGR